MHYVYLVVISVAFVSGSEVRSSVRKGNFSYYFIHNLTHTKLESIFDHLFRWNVSVKHPPSVTSTEPTSQFWWSSESTETLLVTDATPSSWTDNNSNKTASGESWSSTTEHIVWWVPPVTPWWTPDTEKPSETASSTASYQYSTLVWPPVTQTAPWWTPNLTESTTASQSTWWNPVTQDTSWWDGSWTDDSFWQTTSSKPPVSTASTTLVWPPTIGTAPWWTPNLTDAPTEATTAMVSWWIPPWTEDGNWSEETSTSTQTTLATSQSTSVWPPTVGTAPWWTPNLTEATEQITTSSEIMTTSTLELTSATSDTTTPITTSLSSNATESAPPALYNPTSVIGYDVPCGVRHTPYDSGKIVGGYSTFLGEIPWQVSLQVFTGYGYGTRHICGGSIISPYFVLTAAHCVYGSNSNVFSVVGGDYNLFDIEGHEQRRRVERIYTNFYDKSVYKNDIALLELSRPFKFNKFVAPICLPNAGLTVTSDVGLITGWGRLSEGGLLPHILQAVEAPIAPRGACNRTYAAAGYSKYLNPCHVCTGSKEGGIDTCQGDSGGPMACPLPDGRYYLCGITSWGVGCARPNFYGVYTLVSCFSEWIKGILYGKKLNAGETVAAGNFTQP